MAIRQLLLTLIYEKESNTAEGLRTTYHQSVDVDLVHGDVAEFLARIPDDIGEHSSIWLAIRREDGEVISYADGLAPESEDHGWGPMKRIYEIDNGKYADSLRHTARLFADRRFENANEIKQRDLQDSEDRVDASE